MLLRVQQMLIWLAMALATVALAGWLFDRPELAGAQFGTPMLPGAIALTLLCGVALDVAARERARGGALSDRPVAEQPVSDGPVSDGPVSDGPVSDGPVSRRVRMIAAAALALAAIGLGRHLIGLGETIAGAGDLLGAGWLHVSSAAALGNGVIAAALLLPERWQRGPLYPTLLILPIPALITALVGYALDAPALLDTPMFSQLALFATLCIGLQIGAALLLRPHSGWMALLTRASPSGQAGRWLLALAIVLPLLVAGVTYAGRVVGLIRYPFGYAVASVLMVAGIAGIALLVAALLRRAEVAAMASQTLLEAIVENSPALIYAKDREGRFLRVNRRLAEVMGLDQADFVGKTDHDLFPAELASSYRTVDRQVIALGRPVVEEEETRFDGQAQTYLSSKAPLIGEDGTALGIVGISTDITAQKAAEVQLAQKVQRLKLLDEITRAITRRHDIASIFQAAVVAVEEQFEADFAAIAVLDGATDSVRLVHLGPRSHRDRAEFGAVPGERIALAGTAPGAAIAGAVAVQVDRGDPSAPAPPRWCADMASTCCVPILVEDGPYGVLIAARRDTRFDSSETRFLTQLVDHIGLSVQQSIMLQTLQQTVEDLKMSQASALARERLAAIGQMASGIAHDLNNALTPISVHTQALREGGRDLPPEIRSYLRMVDRVIGDMSATISRMRDVYRPDAVDLALAPTALAPLAADVIELTRARWSDMPLQQGIVIGVESAIAPDLPPALIDAAAIRDALTNLILNAVDAMPDGGMIFVRARLDASGERISLEVADSGLGMDAETQARCLDPFFTTKGDRGTGLGLAMVVRAARRHGAELSVDSTPGAGTVMRLSLPVADRAVAAPAPVVEGAGAGQRGGLRVLIVDDDPAVLESTSDYLSIIGFDVVAAEGGQRGIDAAREARNDGRPFDVLITDLGMPYIDGDRVAEAVKAMVPGTYVIMLTGWGSNMPPGQQKPANVDALMAKPPDIGALRQLLDQRIGVGAPA